jgi:manganese-dependent inorganic pyrophosphatase
MDGVACSVAYMDFMLQKGSKVKGFYSGDLSKEVEFVREYTKYFPLVKSKGRYPKDSEFVLVDTADVDSIESVIPPDKVVEIFDHRELFFKVKFTKAKLNIEKVGSCATLMAELFRRNRLLPSQKVATYLYSAIISNTINFKNLVTTDRDIKAAKWLKKIADVGDTYYKKMFEYKSRIRNSTDLKFLIDQDFATHTIHGINLMIAQIEVANLEKVTAKYREVIAGELVKLKKQEKLEYAMFSGIDIIEGFNIFMVIDKKSGDFFSKAMGTSPFSKRYKTKGIIMRKEIWPKVEKILGNAES